MCHSYATAPSRSTVGVLYCAGGGSPLAAVVICGSAFTFTIFRTRNQTRLSQYKVPGTGTGMAPHTDVTTNGSSSVAVLFSGWLGVSVPKRGATARQHLIEVLAADVFVAGTWQSTDFSAEPNCAMTPTARRACYLRRLQALLPLTALRIDRQLSIEELQHRVSRAPIWPWLKKHFNENASQLLQGVSIWAPVLGNRKLSVLRELHDYSRALTLVEEHERSRGRPYAPKAPTVPALSLHSTRAVHPPLTGWCVVHCVCMCMCGVGMRGSSSRASSSNGSHRTRRCRCCRGAWSGCPLAARPAASTTDTR